MSPKISKRPKSICNVLTMRTVAGTAEKLSNEPTAPKPGPILPVEAMDAEKAVIRSTPQAAFSRVPTKDSFSHKTTKLYKIVQNNRTLC